MEAHTAVRPPDEEPRPRRRRFAEARTARRRLMADRLARWTITGGGLAIIASILGILLFILIEVAPLAGNADVAAGRVVELETASARAVLCDEYRTLAAVLDSAGRVRVHALDGGRLVTSHDPLRPDPAAAPGEGSNVVDGVAAAPGHPLFLLSAGGAVLLQPVDWKVEFVGQERRIHARFPEALRLEIDPEGRPLAAFAAHRDESGTATAAAVTADGRLAIVRRSIEENLLTGETSESWTRDEYELPTAVDRLLLDRDQRNLYGGNSDGELLWWRLDEGRAASPQILPAGHDGVTALSLLIGDRSLVVGHGDGTISIWFQVRAEEGGFELTRIRDFAGGPGPLEHLAPSLRGKSFLAADATGRLGLFHSTSQRTLWRGRAALGELAAIFVAPKDDGALLAGPGGLRELEIDNPHPEISLGALFGRVWYEGYTKPQFVWQSTGGTDDFEPKLSLTPLMIGTLKGTLYSLILAIPLGVLGAMYTSQFMHHDLKRYVKPTVEIMAALPSVVLGFLAGLWLAPRIERVLPAIGLMLVVLPLLIILGGFAWRAVPRGVRSRFPAGVEAVVQILVVGLGIWLCLAVERPLELALFGGDIQDWLRETTGLAYDQRNAVVVGLAMGFAVIPIIFSIAEDAFSNVPPTLISGSLALGATRWQTVTRVVLPSASPGIFSAIMIGFGRAVGETMIVLMATGNTPIMDWNPFNGFRTLSANIAVEIPEAPQGATLYRTLFLAALILFVFTFITNTVAELVRQRLRRRYAQL